MIKNVSLVCGLGDLFTFTTRLEDFFEKNPDYSGIRFWLYNHSPELAKELLSLTSFDASLITVSDMTSFLEEIIPEESISKARERFVVQSACGKDANKFIEFCHLFFPNIEDWSYIDTYMKYKTTYPYKLNVKPHVFKEGNQRYIVVHPFSTKVKTEKKERHWTPLRWRGLLSRIAYYYKDYDIVLIGTAQDKIERTETSYNNTYIDLRGKLSLKETISYIYGANAVLGTNSWPTQIACWAGIPTYTQWFVQHQLIPSHFPGDPDKIKFIECDKTSNVKNQAIINAFEHVQKVMDYAESII